MKMNKKIVWIEDDISIINSVVAPLETAGYIIHRIYGPDEAKEDLDLLRDADLILLDLIMPVDEHDDTNSRQGVYPGLELLKYLRFECKIQTPVVLFSVATGRKQYQTKDLQVSDFIPKPIRPSQLKERIEKVLKQSN